MRTPDVRYEKVLNNDSRARIYLDVRAKPGINKNQISKDVGLDYKVVQRHLEVLEFHGLVFASIVGARRVYHSRPYRHPKSNEILAPHEIALMFPPGNYGAIMPDYRQKKI